MYTKPSFECFCGDKGSLFNKETEPFSFTMNNLLARLIRLKLYPQFSVNSFYKKQNECTGFVFLQSDDGIHKQLLPINSNYPESEVRCAVRYRGQDVNESDLEHIAQDLNYIFNMEKTPNEEAVQRVLLYNTESKKRDREEEEEEEEVKVVV